MLRHGLVARNAGLVYGGGALGLMGVVSDSVLEKGGHVTGIMPGFLRFAERQHDNLSRMIITDDMFQRKQAMFDLSDGFLALPGGIGTLEELVEVLTWGQLGRHRKPVALADINGFWRPLVTLLEHMREEAFIRPGFEIAYHVCPTVADILPTLRAACAAPDEEAGANVADLERL